MLTTMAILTALTMSPGQAAGGLNLTNPRPTYGELGSVRPDTKYIQGDIFFLSYDIEGLAVSEIGRVRYGMGMEVLDSTGKSIFKQQPVERDDFLPLGGNKLPARAFVTIGFDQPPGQYVLKVTVTDLSNKEKPVAKTIEQKFEVVPLTYGLVRVFTSCDSEGKIPAPLVGVAGQSIWVHFVVVDFKRDTTSKQPNVSIEMTVYDKDSKPTLPKPNVKQVPDEADGKVDEKALGVPMQFPVPLNREGGFLVELKATDNITKKSTKMYLPLQVFPSATNR